MRNWDKNVKSAVRYIRRRKRVCDLYTLYFCRDREYNGISKVDGARQVPRLGKSADERAHLLCGASVWSVASNQGSFARSGKKRFLPHIGPFLQ